MLQRERYLCKLQTHPQKTSHNHPKSRPGTTQRDGKRNPSDIAKPNRSTQCSSKRPKWRNLSNVLSCTVPAAYDVKCMFKHAKVDKLCQKSEVNTARDKPRYQKRQLSTLYSAKKNIEKKNRL